MGTSKSTSYKAPPPLRSPSGRYLTRAHTQRVQQVRHGPATRASPEVDFVPLGVTEDDVNNESEDLRDDGTEQFDAFSGEHESFLDDEETFPDEEADDPHTDFSENDASDTDDESDVILVPGTEVEGGRNQPIKISSSSEEEGFVTDDHDKTGSEDDPTDDDVAQPLNYRALLDCAPPAHAHVRQALEAPSTGNTPPANPYPQQSPATKSVRFGNPRGIPSPSRLASPFVTQTLSRKREAATANRSSGRGGAYLPYPLDPNEDFQQAFYRQQEATTAPQGSERGVTGLSYPFDWNAAVQGAVRGQQETTTARRTQGGQRGPPYPVSPRLPDPSKWEPTSPIWDPNPFSSVPKLPELRHPGKIGNRDFYEQNGRRDAPLGLPRGGRGTPPRLPVGLPQGVGDSPVGRRRRTPAAERAERGPLVGEDPGPHNRRRRTTPNWYQPPPRFDPRNALGLRDEDAVPNIGEVQDPFQSDIRNRAEVIVSERSLRRRLAQAAQDLARANERTAAQNRIILTFSATVRENREDIAWLEDTLAIRDDTIARLQAEALTGPSATNNESLPSSNGSLPYITAFASSSRDEIRPPARTQSHRAPPPRPNNTATTVTTIGRQPVTTAVTPSTAAVGPPIDPRIPLPTDTLGPRPEPRIPLDSSDRQGFNYPREPRARLINVEQTPRPVVRRSRQGSGLGPRGRVPRARTALGKEPFSSPDEFIARTVARRRRRENEAQGGEVSPSEEAKKRKRARSEEPDSSEALKRRKVVAAVSLSSATQTTPRYTRSRARSSPRDETFDALGNVVRRDEAEGEQNGDEKEKEDEIKEDEIKVAPSRKRKR